MISQLCAIRCGAAVRRAEDEVTSGPGSELLPEDQLDDVFSTSAEQGQQHPKAFDPSASRPRTASGWGTLDQARQLATRKEARDRSR